jgi:hypothetical protein
MNSPDDFSRRELLADFFSGFSETSFFDHEQPEIYLDLFSKTYARYKKDCSLIFSKLHQLNEEGLLTPNMIVQIIKHTQLNAQQLHKTLCIIIEQKILPDDFENVALIQQFNAEQKKIMEKCCHLEIFNPSNVAKLISWISKSPHSPLIFKILGHTQTITNDLAGIIEYAEQFPENKKFHIFIGITVLEQVNAIDSNIVKMFDNCHDPLLLTEVLLLPNVIQLITGKDKELHLKLILNASTPELMLLVLYHLHLLELPEDLLTSIKNRIEKADFKELSQFRNVLNFLNHNPEIKFNFWQLILNDLHQSFEILNLFILLKKYEKEELLPTLLTFLESTPIAQAREMLQQMLISYPHPTYHQHFFKHALPHAPEPYFAFNLYLKLLTQKIYLYHLPPEKVYKLFFACNHSVLVDLFLEYKKSAMLYQQHVHTILSPTVLELLESKPVQLSLQLIHQQSLTKAFVDKQEPQNLQDRLECLHIMKEHHLLSGYESIKNLKLVLKAHCVKTTADKLKKLVAEDALNQDSFERCISQLPSIFKNYPHALTEANSVKACGKF